MDPDQSIQATMRRRYRKQLMETYALFSPPCTGSQGDAEQIPQHSPLNAAQHLGAPTAAEASTSTNTTDPGTRKEQATTAINPIDRGSSMERHSDGEMSGKTLLIQLQSQYREAEGLEMEMERTEIRKLAKDLIESGRNMGKLSSDEVRALQVHFSIHPAVGNKGSTTEIINDTGCSASLADADLLEDKIIEHDTDFFNAFEDDFDGNDLD